MPETDCEFEKNGGIVKYYIDYKGFYYYLRYIKNKRIIFKSMGFTNLCKLINDSKYDKSLILFSCSYSDLLRDYILLDGERI